MTSGWSEQEYPSLVCPRRTAGAAYKLDPTRRAADLAGRGTASDHSTAASPMVETTAADAAQLHRFSTIIFARHGPPKQMQVGGVFRLAIIRGGGQVPRIMSLQRLSAQPKKCTRRRPISPAAESISLLLWRCAGLRWATVDAPPADTARPATLDLVSGPSFVACGSALSL